MSEAHAHHPSVRTYGTVGAILLAGTFAAFVFADALTLPWMATILLIFAIATVKVSLVALFFMHLKWEQNWKFILTIPPLFLFLAYLLALVPDIAGFGVPPLDPSGTALLN